LVVVYCSLDAVSSEVDVYLLVVLSSDEDYS